MAAGGRGPGARQAELLDRLGIYDGEGARRLLDDAIAHSAVDEVIGDLLVPALHEVGERWSDGSWSVAQEHFAASVVENRLQPLAYEAPGGDDGIALLACPGGERHDLPLLLYAALLRARGRRVAVLGAETPLEEVEAAASSIAPAAVVLGLNAPGIAERLRGGPAPRLAAPLFIGGNAADSDLADHLGAALLPNDLVEAADELVAAV